MDDQIFLEQLASVRAVFPGRLAVPASLGAEACGIAVKTFRNRLSCGDPPFATFKVGDRRLVEVVELARFLARQTATPVAAPAAATQARAVVGGEPARGRPRREEEAAAAAVGLRVREFRAAQRAAIAAVEVQK